MSWDGWPAVEDELGAGAGFSSEHPARTEAAKASPDIERQAAGLVIFMMTTLPVQPVVDPRL